MLIVILRIYFSPALILLSLWAKVTAQCSSRERQRAGAPTTLALHALCIRTHVRSCFYTGVLGHGLCPVMVILDSVQHQIHPPVLQSCQGWRSIDWAPQMPSVRQIHNSFGNRGGDQILSFW